MSHFPKRAEFCLTVRRVEQVDGQLADVPAGFAATPRQADDIPIALCRQMIDEIAADHTLRPRHERDLLPLGHVFPPCCRAIPR